jgi:HD superfamily phosphohydrolase YqeK
MVTVFVQANNNIFGKNFEVNDKEILQAIANQTLGRPGMSQLCCIVIPSR